MISFKVHCFSKAINRLKVVFNLLCSRHMTYQKEMDGRTEMDTARAVLCCAILSHILTHFSCYCSFSKSLQHLQYYVYCNLVVVITLAILQLITCMSFLYSQRHENKKKRIYDIKNTFSNFSRTVTFIKHLRLHFHWCKTLRND